MAALFFVLHTTADDPACDRSLISCFIKYETCYILRHTADPELKEFWKK